MAEEVPSFSNAFWGENDKGLDALITRLKHGKYICEAVENLFKERVAIEEEYGKKLAKLAKNFVIKDEIGTLNDSLNVVKTEIEATSLAHINAAEEIKTKLCKPIQDFIAAQSSTRKTHAINVEKHQKIKLGQVSNCIKLKEKYDSKCGEIDTLQTQAKQPLPPKEIEKVNSKLEKAQFNARQYDLDLKSALDKLTQLHKKWEVEMRICSQGCQKLEEERIDTLRSQLWNYTNIISSCCVSDDESCERIRQSLEKCDIDNDIALAVKQYSTGCVVQEAYSYVLEKSPHVRHASLASFSSLNAEKQRGMSTQSQNLSNRRKMSATPTLPPIIPGSVGLSSQLLAYTSSSFTEHTGLQSPPGNESSPRFWSSAEGTINPQEHFTRKDSEKLPSGMLTPQSPFVELAYSNDQVSQFIDGSNVYHHYDPYDVPAQINVLFTVRALYDYTAQAFEELSVQKGEIIPVITTHEDGWWEGVVSSNGQRRKGLFPSNFVEIFQ